MPRPGQKSITVSDGLKNDLENYHIKYLRQCNKENYIGASFSLFVAEMAIKGWHHWKKEHKVK